MTQEFLCLDTALSMAKQGFKVYPTVRGKKIPLKGSHGQLDASNDPSRVFDMFQQEPNADVSLKLENIIVLDIDEHEGGANGRISMRNAGIELPTNTRVEITPNNGYHFFFKYSGEHFNQVNLLPGVEVKGDQIKIAPSKGYELQSNKPAIDAPEWLLKLIKQNRKPKYQSTESYVPGEVTFIGKKLNDLLDGAPQGVRNKWLANQIGFYIGQGVQPTKVYKLMWWITQTELIGSKPIRKSEFDGVFRSIIRREKAKAGA